MSQPDHYEGAYWRFTCMECENEVVKPLGWAEGSTGPVTSSHASMWCLNHEDYPHEMRRVFECRSRRILLAES